MRKNLLFALFLLFAAGLVNAQNVCVPSPIYASLGIPGVFPNPAIQSTLANGDAGVAYTEVFTIVVPQDTTIDLSAFIGFPFPPVSVSVNFQEVSSLSGYPAGLTDQCDQGNCQWAGGTNGCIKLSGIPTQSGTFNVNMATGYNVNVPAQIPVIGGSAITIPFPGGLNWTMDVTGVSVQEQKANSLWIAQNAPNPFHGSTTISYHAPKPAAIDFRVTDLTGKRLHTSTYRAVMGINEIRFDATDLAPGIYLYHISNGDKSVTSKMVIL